MNEPFLQLFAQIMSKSVFLESESMFDTLYFLNKNRGQGFHRRY